MKKMNMGQDNFLPLPFLPSNSSKFGRARTPPPESTREFREDAGYFIEEEGNEA